MPRSPAALAVMLLVTLYLFASPLVAPAQAATCTWTGFAGAAWATPGSWTNCGGGIPQPGDSVVIPSSASNPVFSATSGTVSLATLTIQSGATLTNQGDSSSSLAATDLVVANGGTYVHDSLEAMPGSSSRTLGATSTTRFIRYTLNTCPPFADYGTLFFQVTNYTASVDCGGNLRSIAGNLHMVNTNGQTVSLVSSQNDTHAIGGALYIEGGNLDITSGSGSPNITIGVGFIVLNPATGSLDFGSGSGSPVITLGAGYEQYNATVQHTGSGTATIYVANYWIFDGGALSLPNTLVSFTSTSGEISGSQVTRFDDLTIQSGAIVDVKNVPTVEGTLTNNGTLVQTRFVGGGLTTVFLQITDTAGTTIKHRGLEINTATAMNNTTVEIMGNQADCTANSSPPDTTVGRCFAIAPASPQTATVTFWYLASELNGLNANQLRAYHWTGSGWDPEPGSHTYGSSGSYNSVQVTGVDSYGPFVLAELAPNLVTVRTLDAGLATSRAGASAALWLIAMAGAPSVQRD